jgi:hypothetical protein
MVRNHFANCVKHWMHDLPIIRQDWSALLQTLKGHSGGVLTLSFSPDGKMLASGSHDHTTRLWDSRTGQCCQTLQGHSSAVGSIVFSPDGKVLASGSNDHTVRLWDPVTGKCCQHLRASSAGPRRPLCHPYRDPPSRPLHRASASAPTIHALESLSRTLGDPPRRRGPRRMVLAGILPPAPNAVSAGPTGPTAAAGDVLPCQLPAAAAGCNPNQS